MDPALNAMLTKFVKVYVSYVLQTRLHKQDIDIVDLDKTVIICATREECNQTNNHYLEKITGPVCEYDADDSDNHENGLRC